MLYVSHRLPEVFRLCDRITVLRDGGFVGTFTTRATSATNDIVHAMVGRDLPSRRHEPARAQSTRQAGGARRTRLLDSPACARAPDFRDVSLQVGRGEIVGIFGLVGSGRSELLETIFGLHRPTAGEIAHRRRAGARCAPPRDAARAGVALVPEERQRQGLLFNLDRAPQPGAAATRRSTTTCWCTTARSAREAERLLARLANQGRRASTRCPTR